jgi:hypothetical protein
MITRDPVADTATLVAAPDANPLMAPDSIPGPKLGAKDALQSLLMRGIASKAGIVAGRSVPG